MEFLWFVIGAAIGLAAVWFFLERQFKAQLSDQEARLSETNRLIQQTLERELSAHEGTMQRLLRLEDEDAANKKRIAGLDADAGEIGLELDRLQTQNEELKAQLDVAHDERAQLDALLRRARSDSESAADGIRAQIATLESRLLNRDESATRMEDERDQLQVSLKEALAERDAAVEACKSQIADVESRLRDREEAIASLENELAALRANTGADEA